MIEMHPAPIRIDGVLQEVYIETKLFIPEGILEHKFVPLEWVIIKEVDSDLCYQASYWSVERYWKTFFAKSIYDRLMSKFLQEQEVVVSYINPKKPQAFLPKETKVNGFQSMYLETLSDIRNMDSEQLEYHITSLGYDPLTGR